MEKRVIFGLFAMTALVWGITVTRAGFETDVTTLDFSYLNHRLQASTTTTEGVPHLFIVSDAIYHWCRSATGWRKEKIFESNLISQVSQIRALYAHEVLYLFVLFNANVDQQFFQLENRNGSWTIRSVDWGIPVLTWFDVTTGEDGHVFCTFHQYLGHDRRLIFADVFDGVEWLPTPIPVSDAYSNSYSAMTGDILHCFFVKDRFLQQAQIANGHVEITPLINYENTLTMSILVDEEDTLHALVWGQSSYYARYNNTTGWDWEDASDFRQSLSLDFILRNGDPVVYTQIGDYLMQYIRSADGWASETITRGGTISDAIVLPDNSVRMLVSGDAQAYWLKRDGHWERDLVYSKLIHNDFQIGFDSSNHLFAAMLNRDALAIVSNDGMEPQVQFRAFPEALNADSFLLVIESFDRFHALSWNSKGTFNLQYHFIDTDQIQSELLSNIHAWNPMFVLDQQNSPLCIYSLSDSIIEMYKHDGQWYSRSVTGLDGQAEDFRCIRDRTGSVRIAYASRSESGSVSIFSLNQLLNGEWDSQSIPLDPDRFVLDLFLGSDRFGNPNILVNLVDQHYNNSLAHYRPGSDGWIKTVTDFELPSFLISDYCIDRFDHPFLISDFSSQTDTTYFWNSGDRWRSSSVTLGGYPSYACTDHRIVTNDVNGIVSVVCTSDYLVHFINYKKTVPWFELFLRHPRIHPGDTLELEFQLQNGSTPSSFAGVVILEVSVGNSSLFYNLPSFVSIDTGLEPIEFNALSDEFQYGSVFSMNWPDTGDLKMNLCFWGALLNPDLSDLLSDIVRADWGVAPEESD